MEKELIHEVENKLVEIVGRSNVYVKASPIPEFNLSLIHISDPTILS